MTDFFPLTVTDVRRETADSVSLALAVPAPLRERFRFRHGQHLTLRATLGGEEVRRSYSICSGLDDGEMRVAIKRVEGGRFSCFANESLKPGDTIETMPPAGRFTAPLAPERARGYLLIAAGSGITPVLSIARTVLAREPKAQVTLLYGNRTVASIMFREAIEDLKNRHLTRLRVIHVLSREKQDVELFNGRLDAARIEALTEKLVDVASVDEAFICGPAGLNEDAARVLKARGLAPEHVHVEHFLAPGAAGPAAARPPAAAADLPDRARVTIIRDGVRTEIAVARGETVLEAGMRQGLELPYSCRAGVCATCRCFNRGGKVEMDANYSLEAWELEAGYVLACQSRPRSPELVLDFDET